MTWCYNCRDGYDKKHTFICYIAFYYCIGP